MKCPACGEDNRADASFCLSCGGKLSRACVQCGRDLPPAARFCDGCGQAVEAVPAATTATTDPRSYTPKHLADKILTSRSVLEGERKQVTVLFADVAGSTALAERLDPEEIHQIMDGCFRILLEEVHRYEGTVNQFTGDGIMALFGAPIAHEDAPERAVRAALDMQRALRRYGEQLSAERGIDFRMRIGINTGPVVVGRIGDDLRMDYTAIGDSTNLAARLQTAAAPGTVLISDHTAKLAAGRFVTTPIGPLHLKGKAQPVSAHQVLRAIERTPLVAPSERGFTPLVGRTTELATLETLFDHVRRGSGQVVFVIGEAGIGKSRLLHELHHRLLGGREARTAEVLWLQGRCISFGKTIPFLPLADLLRAGFGIEEADDDATMIRKLGEELERLGPELAPIAPYLRILLALPAGDPAAERMDASARRFATFDALKRLLLAWAARQPVVLVIEDLHWIDPASQECLSYLIDAAARSAVLLLCTHRPGYRPAMMDRSYLHRLSLQPLSADESAMMTAAMLDTATFPAEIRTLVAAKAEGNPFFIEEVTKSLLEIGALERTGDGYVLTRPLDDVFVPDSIHDVIMARIDRLGDEPKRAIQVASVIGREFAVRLLQRVGDLGTSIDKLVGELRALELIYEKFGGPELAYMFKHALTHDVAYESLLVQRRKVLHRTIGHAIEELYADRLSEHWETLAHHFYRAEEWPLAFDYLVKAGNKALAAYANSEALSHFARALEVGTLLGVDAAQTAILLERKGRAHFCLSEFPPAIEAYRQALALVPEVDAAVRTSMLAEALAFAHEFDAAIATAETALRLAEQANTPTLVGKAHLAAGLVRMVRGDLDGAQPFLTASRRIAALADDTALAAHVEAFVGLGANWRGEYRTALKILEPLHATLRRENALLWLVETFSHYGIALGGAGHYRQALETFVEGIALSEAIGDRLWRARMWNTRGWILGEIGAFDAAEEANRRCLELARQMGSHRMSSELIANATLNLADIALAYRNHDDAARHLGHIRGLLSDPRNQWMAWRYGMHFQLAAAELSLARGEIAPARSALDTCVATAQRTGSRRYQVRATLLGADVLAAADDLIAAEQQLAATLQSARGLGNPAQLWKALAARGRVLHRLGRQAEADAAAAEMQRVLQTTAADLPSDLRSGLLSKGT